MTFLQLRAFVSGDRTAATARVRDAFSNAGAWITDVHFFSGLEIVFSFEVAPDRALALEAALIAAGLELGDKNHEMFAAAAASTIDEVKGTLAVTFRDGDPDLKHDVPSVPG